MKEAMSWRAAARAAIFAVLAAALGGCAGGGVAPEDKVGNLFVAPGKYQLYKCDALAATAQGEQRRQRELEELIAKAESGPGGEVAASLAYKTDYYQVRGNLSELRREAAEKKCKPWAQPAIPPAAAAKPAR